MESAVRGGRRVHDKCCKGGWPPKLGRHYNDILKNRAAFKNEWQNIRAFTFDGAVKNLCPPGYKFKKGTREPGDPECVVNAKETYTPVQGCDECVQDGNAEMCGVEMPSGESCRCNAISPPAAPPPPSSGKSQTKSTSALADESKKPQSIDCPSNAISVPGSSSCQCDAGYTGEHEACSACAAGTYKSGSGSGECAPCEAGKFSEGPAAISCAECPSKSHSVPGSSECECDPGFEGSHESCVACTAGKFKPSAGSEGCTDCVPGKFSDTEAAVGCDECAANTDSLAGSTDCFCNAGYAGAGSDTCVACSQGTYKQSTGSGACQACAAGTFSNVKASLECDVCAANSDSDPGATSCSCNPGFTGPGSNCAQCNPGTFKPEAGSGACYKCHAGKYSADPGQSTCLECPVHSGRGEGSSSCDCVAGYTGLGLAGCTMCSAGKYKSTVGSAFCTDCAAGKYSEASAATSQAACKNCPAGKYSAVVGAYSAGFFLL